jgi:trehalose 6-phosphate synthase
MITPESCFDDRERLAVVSNRLPVRIIHTRGKTRVKPGGGGLVTAMEPVLGGSRGTWIGWDGNTRRHAKDSEWKNAARDLTYDLCPVPLTTTLVKDYYHGFANATLWPLFHDLLGRAQFHSRWWDAYRRANLRFAERSIEATTHGDAIWAQDYHLALLGEEVRKRADRTLLFFLHIPFPSLDIYKRLPWRRELMHGLLAYDLLGFQTRRDVMSFLECVRQIVPSAKISGAGGSTVRLIKYHDREIRVGWFPISIDYAAFRELAGRPATERTAERLRRRLTAETLILGVDRLDYSKGIPQRIRAFEKCLQQHPEHRGRVSLVQVAVPSRESVREYRKLRDEMERLIGAVNGRFSRGGWAPIHYLRRNLTRAELVVHYRACRIALVTPLKDGMNLVAKEFCASNVDEDGVLILSEFAGAASQLFAPSLIVNPHGTQETADAIDRALRMGPLERQDRMRRLRRQVRTHDIRKWVRSIAQAAQFIEHPEGVSRD